MLGRAEIVQILMHAHVSEGMAWEIAIKLSAEYLESMDEAAVRKDTDELVYQYMERIKERIGIWVGTRQKEHR